MQQPVVVPGRRRLATVRAVRICVIGAGSLGSAIGGTLAAAGNDVVLVTRNRAHVEAISRRWSA